MGNSSVPAPDAEAFVYVLHLLPPGCFYDLHLANAQLGAQTLVMVQNSEIFEYLVKNLTVL